MFKRLFIRKYEIEVLKYIKEVYEEPVKEKPISQDASAEKSSSSARFSIELEAELCDPEEYKKEKKKEPYKRYPQSLERQIEVINAVASHEVKYSDRAPAKKDLFDAATVSATMSAYLNEQKPATPLSAATNLTFVQMLQAYMRKKKLLETQVYKAAMMDRRLFSKIMCDINYKPSKDTVLALIFALKLSLAEARDLLERAGYTLSHSIKRDIIIEYFIKERIYNLDNVNAFLYNMDEKIIGRNV